MVTIFSFDHITDENREFYFAFIRFKSLESLVSLSLRRRERGLSAWLSHVQRIFITTRFV